MHLALDGAKLRVDRGGVIDAVQTDGSSAIAALEVDVATGAGMFRNVSFAQTGTINAIAAGRLKGKTVLPMTLENCTGAANLANWSVKINGEANSAATVEWADASFVDLTASLGYLAEAVHAHWKVKPLILIDEYDQPISSASTFGYYDRMCSFMRMFLSGALKDNKHCEMGLMTGVLRVAKEGILSGLNNLRVYTVFDPEFSEYFGFTEDEVTATADYYGVSEKMDEIRDWYDGYDFGGTEIFNPWSVLNYFDRGCRPAPYWLDTSSNDLITEIVRNLPHDIARTLETLLRDGKVRVPLAEELGPYAEIKKRKSTLYTLLVSAGYLKVSSPVEDGTCVVRIPNRELEHVFVADVMKIGLAYFGKRVELSVG